MPLDAGTKAALEEGTSYDGHLSQFDMKYKLSYTIGPEARPPPVAVREARSALGWSQLAAYCCACEATAEDLGGAVQGRPRLESVWLHQQK